MFFFHIFRQEILLFILYQWRKKEISFMVYSIFSVISDIEHEGHGPLVDLYYVKTNSHQQSQQFVQSCNDKAHKMNKVLKHTIL